jgi:hypothetical protein
VGVLAAVGAVAVAKRYRRFGGQGSRCAGSESGGSRCCEVYW